MSDESVTDVQAVDRRIAIVGMAGRFPMAPDVERFWAACRDGTGCISRWGGTAEEGRVPAGGLVAGQDLFDPEAFGISPADAAILDPQHRVFLEVAWHALADAAIASHRSSPVCVYASAAPSRYRPTAGDDDENSRYRLMIANAPDYLAARVAHHLDLGGEAVTVQTACSSSLVAVHLACMSLQAGRSDVALAGGVSIDPDQERGYRYQEGMIASPDGVCLPFDVGARGAVPGNGAAAVVLQRLSDAVAQRRRIHAVILATAVNNDGRVKRSFMAPNVEGQSEVIATALAVSGVPATTIGYLETHGTATRLGDAIEIEAARTAFGWFTQARSFCALGSLKSNFGHLDRAAGVTGLIKAALAVREGVIPPLHGFETTNPDLGLESSPFRVPTRAEPWPAVMPRRAGVTSLGVGGTNAHVIVEASTPTPPDAEPTPADVMLALPLSAHSQDVLVRLASDLADALAAGKPYLRDVARTLAAGRTALQERAVFVATPSDAVARLREPLPAAVTAGGPRTIAFVFPGQGSEVGYRVGALAERYPAFRAEIAAFASALGVEAAKLIAGVDGLAPEYRAFAWQPALVAVQVALARLAEDMGLAASVLCGSSLGEYAAAYLAGVFDRRGLMRVLAARDRLMRSAPEGRMLAVLASLEAIEGLLLPDIDLAGENGAGRLIFSGSPEAVERQHALLNERGVMARVLPGRIGPHGRLMTAVAVTFREVVANVELSPAARPIVSTLTGERLDPHAPADPEHWVRHLCEPFRFSQAIEGLRGEGADLFVEASPGTALTKILRTSSKPVVAVSLGGEADDDPVAAFLSALGEAWCAGGVVAWEAVNDVQDARFVALPPYPFKRRRFWSDDGGVRRETGGDTADGHLERPVWRPRLAAGEAGASTARPVVVNGSCELAVALVARLAESGVKVLRADASDRERIGEGAVLVDLANADAARLEAAEPTNDASLATRLQRDLLAPAALVERLRPAWLLVATRGLFPVAAGELSSTANAGAVGLARCAPHDWPGLRAQIIDLPASRAAADLDALLSEIAAPDDGDVAYRGGMRYTRRWEAVRPGPSGRLRAGGIYLVLGGTGRLGAVVAEAISREAEATIVLVGRDVARESAAVRRLVDVARARGTTVVRWAARVDQRDELAALLDACAAKFGQINGVFHLAANTDTASFQLLGESTAPAAHDIARAKVCTAALLAEMLAGREYDFVALFSSISTVIGAARFGTYVAANAHLDALAQRMRQQTGHDWCSIVWDGWSTDGRPAVNALDSDTGARLLLRALRVDAALVAPVVRPLEERRAAVAADLAAAACTDRATSASRWRTAAETARRVVAEVTGHDSLDPNRKLASLGVDSLQMMQIAVRLRSMLDLRSGVGKLLAATSLAELVALAEVAAVAAEPSSDTPRHETVANALSTPQQRLWYLAELDPASSSYNVPFGWAISNGDPAAVRATIDTLLDRHEVLRTAYRVGADGLPRRAAIARSEVPVLEIAIDTGDPEESFARRVRPFVEERFDLAAGSTRVLIAAGPDATRLVFVCHHLSIDAWSIRVLRDELSTLLDAGASRRAPLAAPRAQYEDFVRYEHQRREGPEYEQLVAWWRDALRGAVPTAPPVDADVSPTGERPIGRAETLLDAAGLDALRATLRAEGATLYAGALTALCLALCSWCGTQEVTIGTNLANRMHETFEPVVGMFVDPVVLRLSPGLDETDATLGTALAHVRERFAGAISHTGIPYLDVVRTCHRRDAVGDNPLFSVIATMFDTEEGASALVPLNLPLPEHAKFALAIEFLPRADGLVIHALYDADRYRPAIVQRVLATIRRLLEAMNDVRRAAPLAEVLAGPEEVITRDRFARRLGRLRDRASGISS